MNKIFDINSRFMQTLQQVGDFILLNTLFLLCCLPLVTIGAAKTALYRVMFDMQEGNGGLYKKFFKVYFRDMGPSVVLFLLKNSVTVFLAWECWLIWNNDILPMRGFLLGAVVLFLIGWSTMFSNMGAQICMFKSTLGEYLKNAVYITLNELWRALAVGLMDIFPVLFFLLDPALFGALGPLWLFLYFTVTVSFSAKLWKKPFDRYVKNAEQN